MLLKFLKILPSPLKTKWANALQSELVNRATQADSINRNYKTTYLVDLTAVTRFYLGTGWSPVSTNTRVKYALSQEILEVEINELSPLASALIAETYRREGKKPPIVDDIVRYLSNSIRIQGRTAYISSNLAGGFPYSEGYFIFANVSSLKDILSNLTR